MRDEDKPFICVRSGWNFKISPRNAAGWRAFGLWMASFFVLTGLFVLAMAAEDKPVLQATWTGIYIVATIVWSVVMIRWMYVRSEVINMEEILRERRRSKGSGRKS